MSRAVRRTAAARLPPAGLPGLRPEWSRLIEVVDADAIPRTFHVLDNKVAEPIGTILCAHGNPTWSYLWRRVFAEAPASWRVIAPDHLDMGYSERTGTFRRLERRIDDLGRLTDALGVSGPVVTMAHDWGGPISLGWALSHREKLRGIVLANTALHQPGHSAPPSIIRLARSEALRELSCVRTSTFVAGTQRLSRGRNSSVRKAFLAPYDSADRRGAIADFVADIPLEHDHPSAATLDAIADGVRTLTDVPALILWGPNDPVFSDRYLGDLLDRLPDADVHRFEGTSHLVTEDVPLAITAALAWITSLPGDAIAEPVHEVATPAEVNTSTRLWDAIEARRDDDTLAVLSWVDGAQAAMTWRELARRVDAMAAGLSAVGVNSGDRVGLLVPPGPDLTALVYACWRIGAVVVIADAGLGLKGLWRAFRGASPKHLVAIAKGLAVLRTLSIPGERILVGNALPVAVFTGHTMTLESVENLGSNWEIPPSPGPDESAAVVFTSGATGPAKGVVYRHRQLEAQRDALIAMYDINSDDRLVAAFAPFALYGPALGITSAVPDMDVTEPATLTGSSLAAAAEAIEATMVFASPAALRNVVATRSRKLANVRLLMSAGAPVSPELLADAAALFPNARAHTPYGMTECLPVADIDLDEIVAAGYGNGVCVGRAAPGVEIALIPLENDGTAIGQITRDRGVTGEIVVMAAHLKDHYDRLWWTERAASLPGGWHRTGDVGHFDFVGRLWVEGRIAHLIHTADGPVTPVGLEQECQSVPGVELAAAVGVGPRGTQALVLVLEISLDQKPGPASAALTALIRASVSVPPAAVLISKKLPVDIRHNSKIDRTAVAQWAAAQLAGQR